MRLIQWHLKISWRVPGSLAKVIPVPSSLHPHLKWWLYFLFILFGVLRRFQHCTGHITMGSWKGRGNQYIQFVRALYCKLPTNCKQLPAFPLEAMPGTEPRPQRWEARVLPLCHRGPKMVVDDNVHQGQPLHLLKYALQIFTDASKKGKCSFRGQHCKGNLVPSRKQVPHKLPETKAVFWP